MSDRLTLRSLERRAESYFDDYYVGPHADYQDEIFETADYVVPIYHSDRLELALDEIWLATEDSEFGSTNASQIIAENILNHIQEHLTDYLRHLNETWDETHADCENCGVEFDIGEFNIDDEPYFFCCYDCRDEYYAELEDEEQLTAE